jgi:hypothetical protein
VNVDRERVKLWVDALRSGEFEQGYSLLRTSEGRYCCLGVACEVARRNGLELDSWKDEDGDVAYGERHGSDWSTMQLPGKVADWYGFVDDAGNSVVDPPLATCTDGDLDDAYVATFVNDSMGANFSRIADLVEQIYLTPKEEK